MTFQDQLSSWEGGSIHYNKRLLITMVALFLFTIYTLPNILKQLEEGFIGNTNGVLKVQRMSINELSTFTVQQQSLQEEEQEQEVNNSLLPDAPNFNNNNVQGMSIQEFTVTAQQSLQEEEEEGDNTLPDAPNFNNNPKVVVAAPTTATSSTRAPITPPPSSSSSPHPPATTTPLPSLSLPPTARAPNRHPSNLYIHVIMWREGMAAWKVALGDVLALAKSLNATFVEPCVSHGRLTSCGVDYTCGGGVAKCSPKESKPIQLHDIYDLDKIRKEYWPHIVGHEEFVKATNYHPDIQYTSNDYYDQTLFVACIKRGYKGEKPANPPCKTEMRGKVLPTTFGSRNQPVLEKAFLAAKNQNPDEKPIILDVGEIWRNGLRNWKPNLGLGMNPLDLFDVERMLRFPSSAPLQVQSMLQQFNITDNNYAVIQWRPEAFTIDYTMCANTIIQMRELIHKETGIPLENFVLISPLSLQKSLQWGGVRRWAEKQQDKSYPSLQLLYHAGFHKLEQTFDDEDMIDGSLLSVWDFVLAQDAKYFTNCARTSSKSKGEKGKSQFCDKCNHRGFSQDYAIELRREIQGEVGTHDEWPI